MSNNEKKFKRIRITIQIILITLLIFICVYGIIKLYPIFKQIQTDPEYRESVVEWLNGIGGFGWLILIFMQIIQTILAFIPSGPIVMIAGILYHPILATFICLIGQIIGAVIVIYFVKWLGYKFISLFINPEKTKKIKLFEDPKRCGVLLFSYLLIPALPKDPINFIVPFTKLKIRYFILISFFARLPMTVVTVVFGNSLMNGDFELGIILVSIVSVLAIICFIFNKKIVQLLDKIISRNN